MNYKITSNSFNETFNDDWYTKLKKSSLTPPSKYFGVVWALLYFSLIISFVIFICNDGRKKSPLGFYFFIIQLLINLSWSLIFFKLKQIKLAVLIIILTIIFTILTIIYFWKVNIWSSILLIPYVLWLIFALYLNSYIALNNH